MALVRISLVAALIAACGGGGAAGDGDLPDADTSGGAITFSNFRVEEITDRRAVVRFDTSVPTSCELEYGTAMGALDKTATDPDMEPGELALDHGVPVEDLAPDTEYFFRARATDANDVTERSMILSFRTTDGSGSDPTASMTNLALLTEGSSVAAVSSNWGGGNHDSSFGVHKALDGSMSTEWSSNGDGDDAYVELDLGQSRTITYFAFRSRMMTDGTSITKKVRLVAGSTILGPFDTPDHTVRYVFPIAPALTTRTIRVEAVQTTGGNTGAKEIQLY